MKKESQLTNEIKKLQYQLSYSEHINKEISCQLAAACEKLGIQPSKFKDSESIKLIDSQVHLQELYYVEPLLMRYEEVMGVMKGELEQAKEESESIRDNVEKVVNENGFLRKELEAKIQLLLKSDSIGLNVNFLTLENRDLHEKLQILNSKNEFLVRKNKELTQENEKLLSENLSLFSKKEVEKVETEAMENYKLQETELIQLRSELDIINNQLNNEKEIVLDLNRKIVQVENESIRLRNEVKVSKQQLENSQTLNETKIENLQSELQSTKEQLTESLRKEQELFTKAMGLESEIQDKATRTHNLNVQNTQLQSNNSSMLQMLESYEVKVNGLMKKNKKMEADLKEFGEEKSEIAKRMEVAEWKLSEKMEEIERKEVEWRKEKLRINKMWEDRLDGIRKSYETDSRLAI